MFILLDHRGRAAENQTSFIKSAIQTSISRTNSEMTARACFAVSVSGAIADVIRNCSSSRRCRSIVACCFRNVASSSATCALRRSLSSLRVVKRVTNNSVQLLGVILCHFLPNFHKSSNFFLFYQKYNQFPLVIIIGLSCES